MSNKCDFLFCFIDFYKENEFKKKMTLILLFIFVSIGYFFLKKDGEVALLSFKQSILKDISLYYYLCCV